MALSCENMGSYLICIVMYTKKYVWYVSRYIIKNNYHIGAAPKPNRIAVGIKV